MKKLPIVSAMLLSLALLAGCVQKEIPAVPGEQIQSTVMNKEETEALVGRWDAKSVKGFTGSLMEFGSEIVLFFYEDGTACLSYRNVAVTDINYIETRAYYTCAPKGDKLGFMEMDVRDYYLNDTWEIEYRDNLVQAQGITISNGKLQTDGTLAVTVKMVEHNYTQKGTYICEKTGDGLERAPRLMDEESITTRYEENRRAVNDTGDFCQRLIDSCTLPIAVMRQEQAVGEDYYAYYYIGHSTALLYEEIPFAVVASSHWEQPFVYDEMPCPVVSSGDMEPLPYTRWTDISREQGFRKAVPVNIRPHPGGKYVLVYPGSPEEFGGEEFPQAILEAFVELQ